MFGGVSINAKGGDNFTYVVIDVQLYPNVRVSIHIRWFWSIGQS